MKKRKFVQFAKRELLENPLTFSRNHAIMISESKRTQGSSPQLKMEVNTMKEYTIYYKSIEGENMVGSGRGQNETEAVEDFRFWHGDCAEITAVEFYK